MFGDVFGLRTDYSKGILYASRRQFLVEPGYNQELGVAWAPNDRVQPPRSLMSKHQVKRELMRRRRVAQGTESLRHLRFLEEIQEYSDRTELMRSVLQLVKREPLPPLRGKDKEASTPQASPGAMSANLAGSTSGSTGAGASAIARLKGVVDSKKAPPDNKPGESASPLTKKGLATDAMGRMLRKASNSAPSNQTPADLLREKLQKQLNAWIYVPGPGHPYWINHSTGGMQFESPFGDAPAEEEGPPGNDEDHFGFIDDWRFHRAPRFASAPGHSG